jgi:hypothetical protein
MQALITTPSDKAQEDPFIRNHNAASLAHTRPRTTVSELCQPAGINAHLAASAVTSVMMDPGSSVGHVCIKTDCV